MAEATTEEVLYDFYRRNDPESTRDYVFGEQDIMITSGGMAYSTMPHSDFVLDGSNHVFIAGLSDLTQNDITSDGSHDGFYFIESDYNGGFVRDAEKKEGCRHDKYMCWAAADANLMMLTGWVTSQKTDEDQIFNLYRDSFRYGETLMGSPEYGAEWYINGTYSATNWVGCDQCKPGTGGYFAHVTNTDAYVSGTTTTNGAYEEFEDSLYALREGKFVALTVEQRDFGNNFNRHVITLQGYTYELKEENGVNREKITGIVVTDSDDDWSTSGGSSNAPNIMKIIPVHYLLGDVFLDWRYLGSNMNNGYSPAKIVYTTTVAPANYTTLSSGGGLVRQGATLLFEVVNPGAKLKVSAHGLAMNSIISSGGTQTVLNGGVALNTTIFAGGSMIISSGGKATGMMSFNNTAVVSAFNGGIVDFDISNTAPTNTALVNNLSVIQGAPVYTLTVSPDTASGLYRLADGASNFEESITVKNANGTTMGTLNVSVMERIGGVSYLLDETNGHLAVSVIDTPMKAPEFFSGSFSGGDTIFAAQSGNTVYFYTDETGWDTPLSLGTGWEALGAGDFDGDGATDVLRINSEGYVVGEMSEGDGTFSQEVLNALGTGWSVVGIGDFNNNGHDDVLVANPTGASETVGLIGYWESGTTWNVIDGYLSGDWWVVGTGDFNGDGKCDILWKGSELGTGGQVSDSYHAMLVGVDPNVQNWIEVEETSPALQYLCSGDFDGDGTTDVALIDGTGEVNVWGVIGGEMVSSSVFNSNEGIDTSVWSFAGVADFNGDGTDDIAWCNRITGQVSCWEIEEMEIADTQTLAYLA